MSEFYSFLLLGGFLIIFEILVGFSVFWYFLFGLACILTALSTQLYPGWEPALGFLAFYTAVSVLVMIRWVRPFLQRHNNDSWHDLVGQMTEVTADILPGAQGGMVKWSGVNWKARLAEGCREEIISHGKSVTVESISGITLFVKPTDLAAVDNSAAIDNSAVLDKQSAQAQTDVPPSVAPSDDSDTTGKK